MFRKNKEKQIEEEITTNNQNDSENHNLKSKDKEEFVGRKLQKDEELGYLGPLKIIIFDPKNSCDCKYFFGFWICLCHLLIGVTVFITIKPFFVKFIINPLSTTIYDLHIFFCCIGYQLLIAEGILCLNSYNACAPPLSLSHMKVGHYTLVVIGSLFAVAGTILGLFHENFELRSLHSIFGASAACFILGGLLNGICAAKMKRCVTFWKLFHTCFGLPAFVLSSVALIYGLLQKSDHNFALEGLADNFDDETRPSTDPFTSGSTEAIDLIDLLNYTTGSPTYDITGSTYYTAETQKSTELQTKLSTNNFTYINNIIQPNRRNSFVISYILALSCGFYTIGIAGMPIVKICTSWSEEIF